MSGIAFGNQYINNLLSQRISCYFFQKLRSFETKIEFINFPPKTFFFFFSPLFFIRTTFPRIANGSQFVIFGPFSFTSDIELNIRPSAFYLKSLLETTVPHFPSCLPGHLLPISPRFIWMSIIYPTCRRAECASTAADQQPFSSLSCPHLLQYLLNQEPESCSGNISRTPCLC